MKIGIAIAVLAVIILLGIYSLRLDELKVKLPEILENGSGKSAPLRQFIGYEQKMTFEVTVPKNTPSEDTVHIFLNTQKNYKMNRVDNFKFSITLSKDIISPDMDGIILYRYSRNGYNFRTAEYLEPDTNDYFWTRKGRTTKFEKGKLQKDKIERWRWFPDENKKIVKTSSIEPRGNFLPRINGMEFRSGQIIEDLYEDAYDDFFDSTAIHMKDIGYKWVEIDPPLQLIIDKNGYPKVVNDRKNNPNYPDMNKLKEEILTYKKKRLHVMLAPQLCCEKINYENQSKEWFDVYFKEVEDFLVEYAKVAKETGVDAFHYAVNTDYQGEDKDKRWRRIFSQIRKHFSGEVGEMIWNFGQEPGAIIPDEEYITWGKELDYFYVAIDTPISKKDNPTDEELEAGAGKMLDGTKRLYDKYGKPIFIRTTYFNVNKTWKGNSFYAISSVPWFSDSEAALEKSIYDFGPEDQARVVNAYFKAIAKRPYIIGYAQFGYTHWENPLSADLSVRGKPGEDVWRKWNKVIYKSTELVD